jgi:hypothetical protein
METKPDYMKSRPKKKLKKQQAQPLIKNDGFEELKDI